MIVVAVLGVLLLLWMLHVWAELSAEDEKSWDSGVEIFCRGIDAGLRVVDARRAAIRYLVDKEGMKWDDAESHFDDAVEYRWGVRIDAERREDVVLDALKKAMNERKT